MMFALKCRECACVNTPIVVFKQESCFYFFTSFILSLNILGLFITYS